MKSAPGLIVGDPALELGEADVDSALGLAVGDGVGLTELGLRDGKDKADGDSALGVTVGDSVGDSSPELGEADANSTLEPSVGDSVENVSLGL